MGFIFGSESIGTFIGSHYDVIFRGDPVKEDFSNATEFLLCDENIVTCDVVNSLFIEKFSSKKDFVLVPEVPSMQVISSDEVSLRFSKVKARFMGWDLGTHEQIFGNNMQSELKPLELVVRRLIHDVLHASRANRESLKEEAIKSTEKLYHKLLEFQDSSYPDISDLVRNRIASMQASIQKASEATSGRVFLISHEQHLKKEEDSLASTDALDKFYQSIKSRNVVILTAKNNDDMPETSSATKKAIQVEEEIRKEAMNRVMGLALPPPQTLLEQYMEDLTFKPVSPIGVPMIVSNKKKSDTSSSPKEEKSPPVRRGASRAIIPRQEEVARKPRRSFFKRLLAPLQRFFQWIASFFKK